jgi:glycosyltransferase involved in cell wall biosynthesis
LTRLRILFVGASGDRYGADAVLRSVAGHFRATGSDVLVVLPEDGPGKEALTDEDLRVAVRDTVVLRKADLHLRGLARSALKALPAVLSHRRVIRRERVDVVWVNTITLPLWLFAARSSRVHSVCHTHEIVGGPRWLRRLLYAPLFLTQRIVTVSRAARDDILEVYPSLSERIEVALNPSFAVREPIPVSPEAEAEVVVIGRISERKGLGTLMDALDHPSVAKERPIVHVCGTAYRSRAAQAFAASIRRRAATSGADVRFHGYLPTEEALALGGIVVVPSLDPDPCPLVVAEAMTAGRAVVATECGGIPELSGGAALLVESQNPSALANALVRLVREPSDRVRLRSQSLERASALSVERYLVQMSELLESLASDG